MVRSLLYADDESYRITGYRRLNPIHNQDAERRFLDAAEKLFPFGITISKMIDFRLPIGFRCRSASSDCCYESPNICFDEILWYDREMGTRNQSI